MSFSLKNRHCLAVAVLAAGVLLGGCVTDQKYGGAAQRVKISKSSNKETATASVVAGYLLYGDQETKLFADKQKRKVPASKIKEDLDQMETASPGAKPVVVLRPDQEQVVYAPHAYTFVTYCDGKFSPVKNMSFGITRVPEIALDCKI